MLDLYAKGELSPVEVMHDVLARADAVGPVLNPFCEIHHDDALAAARAAEAAWKAGTARPLEGVPVSIKDTTAVKGFVFARGAKWAADAPPADADSPLVERLRDAGAVVWANTTTCEGGWKATTDSPRTGITRNAHDPAITPGGSSGGAGASIAAGCGPLGIGSDGGGSIRIPSSFSGIFGLKPSFGRVAQGAYGAQYSDFSHHGPMVRHVADAVRMMHAMEGRDARDPFTFEPAHPIAATIDPLPLKGLKLGITEDFGFLEIDPEVRAAFKAAVAAIAAEGAEIVDMPGYEDWRPTYRAMWQAGAANQLANVPVGKRDLMDQEFRGWGEVGSKLPLAEYLKARDKRIAYRQIAARQHATVDFVLSPTVAILPFGAGLTVPDARYPDWLTWGAIAFLHNMTGQPAASLPVGFSAGGLPIGMQIAGRAYDDLGVLRLSLTLESLLTAGRYDVGAVVRRALGSA
ncbi:amidase [Ameyamaea chiangmaiensis]|nr:amidase [Ameyamaea chiangmaiensis]